MIFRNNFSITLFIISFLISIVFSACSQTSSSISVNTDTIDLKAKSIVVGAEQMDLYVGLLLGKNISIVANPSSLVKRTHLIDTLLSLDINIKKVMSPEHGFRGDAGAGEHIKDGIDSKTGLPIISLYGAHKKPTKSDLQDIDILIFDLQDVGTRFYTYLSTLHLCMEACAENNVKLIVFDRPNPNGYYVDGPILEKEHKSFVGLDPVPIVHGMTLGEYALMLNGEHWLSDSLICDIEIITIKNYDHKMSYNLPIRPSPNLPNNISINLYPSLCLFEGTIVSIGRGTDLPFQMYGHPDFLEYDTIVVPVSIKNIAPNPKLKGQKCKAFSLENYSNDIAKSRAAINLNWLIDSYNSLDKRKDFFNSFFSKLAGTNLLQQQIESGMSAEAIKQSWQADLDEFKLIRKKYLLYTDFE